MRITSLVENTTKSELKTKHGLSLYIETKSHKILFDLGSDSTLFENAMKRNIDISKVDTVIISHGHFDHGGALKKFLNINSVANIYVQKEAFEPHYSKTLFLKIPVGIDSKLKSNRQIKLLNGNYKIDEELSLFTVSKTNKFYSPANNALYDKKGKDTFVHEQNLIISENKVVVIMGCGHAGVVNIMEEAEKYQPHFCIGGFHLFNPLTKKTVSKELLNSIAMELQKYKDIEFYTCHCTGEKAYHYLSQQVESNMAERTYISLYGKCGKIHIFKSTIRAIGQPKFIRFRLSKDGRVLLEPYDRITLTSFRVPKDLDEMSSTMEVSTTALIRIIFREWGFDTSKSYRIQGTLYEDRQFAIFDISSAKKITDTNKPNNFPDY